MNKRQTGTTYENAAAEYLIGLGMEEIERNFRTGYGEIDLIMKDGDYTVFVEVKYRSTGSKGSSLYAVDYRKRMQIIKMAKYYCIKNSLSKIRFDCVGFDGDKIRYIKNAFDGRGKAW